MKKIIMTIAIVLGLSLTSFANPNGGGMFNRGREYQGISNQRPRSGSSTPMLPVHGQDTNQAAPLGSGLFMLTALGAAYLIGKRRKED